VQQRHNPRVVRGPDDSWLVECRECRADKTTEVPIGIGMPLADRLTADRLAENHRGPMLQAS
jgi:hypothetical protein